MKEIIKDKLRLIEREKNVRILLACETGSRGWGFPSPDSDYDVRFLYVHPADWYISVREKDDHITVPINDELDITGWELKKSLQLMMKHNAALMERLQSPIIYSEVQNFREDYFSIAKANFSPVSVMHHYLSMSKSYFEKCTISERVKLKSLFYCIRTTLACHWILQYKTLPPMELEKLLPVITDNKELVSHIRELVKIKSGANESYIHPTELRINEYLEKTIASCEESVASLPGNKYTADHLDIFLKKYIYLFS
ncbi:MAG: DNA polymerase beta superfamily protein [Bacteroidota bacterium]